MRGEKMAREAARSTEPQPEREPRQSTAFIFVAFKFDHEGHRNVPAPPDIHQLSLPWIRLLDRRRAGLERSETFGDILDTEVVQEKVEVRLCASALRRDNFRVITRA